MTTLMLLVMVSLGSNPARADDWFCKSQASERIGNSLHTCGIGGGKDEASARQAALESAQREFKALCESSDDCVGHKVSVEPGRTDCAPSEAGFRCYRIAFFTVLGVSPAWRFSAHRSLWNILPKIKQGMSRADVLKNFEPSAVVESDMGPNAPRWEQLFFKGMTCENDGLCSIVVQNGRVKSIHLVKPAYR